MKKLWLAALTLALCLLSACGGGPELSSLDTETVEEDCVSFLRPAAWQPAEPASAYGICAFRNEEESLSLEVVGELGTMEYYSLEELGEETAQTLADSLFAAEPDTESRCTDDYYSSVMQGQDEDGQDLVCRIDLLMPYPSVHYYLLTLATPAAYQDNVRVLDGIRESFTLTKTDEEIYHMIQEERKAAAEEASSEQPQE
ncbi:MAG: hypothetical protein IKD93_08935 [Firmicutes bacterium]|nr:hypothetical protein [Bacillota bacterium]